MTDKEFTDMTAKLLNEAKDKEPAPKEKTEQEISADFAAKTLTGDIRDFLLDRVKQMGKPFVAMTEDEQSDQIHACRDAAESLVKKAVEILASGGKKSYGWQADKSFG